MMPRPWFWLYVVGGKIPPPKTKMETQNRDLEDDFAFQRSDFFISFHVDFQWCIFGVGSRLKPLKQHLMNT